MRCKLTENVSQIFTVLLQTAEEKRQLIVFTEFFKPARPLLNLG